MVSEPRAHFRRKGRDVMMMSRLRQVEPGAVLGEKVPALQKMGRSGVKFRQCVPTALSVLDTLV